MFTSIHGRAFGYDQNNLYLNGQIVGNPLQGRGKYIYVDSAVDGASGASPSEAVGTLDEAFALCTANRGDTIVVMPNHAETVTGVGGITADVAGVTVIGLGSYNQRPRFLMDGGTTVTVAVTAADVTFRNLVFASGHLLVTACFVVTAVGFWADQLEFCDNTTAENWATPFKATGAANTADGLKITNCRWVPLISSVNALEFIEITDDIADLVVLNNLIVHEGTASPLILQAGTKVMTRVNVGWNMVSHKQTSGDLMFDNGASANSGVIHHNFCRSADTDAQLNGAVGGCGFWDNFLAGASTVSGAIEPAAETPLT